MSELLNEQELIQSLRENLLAKPYKPKNGYDITGKGGGAGSVMFMMDKKPRWHHRFFTKLFLGWVWVDGENQKRVL